MTKPSLGSAWQMKLDVVMLAGLVHSGGLPVAGSPKASTSRRFEPSQLLPTE
jgi:hypothetical protein